MTLAARLRLLLAGLAAGTALLLILLFDATLDRFVEDRIAERISLEMGHLARDLASVPPQNVDAFLRTTARDLACRITLIAPDGRVRNDTDLLPADVPNMENHADRPEVREALARGSGISSRFSATLEENRIYLARRLSDGDILRMSVPAARVREIESV